ncbi:unnamed protein product [Cylicocyclus nassatus]|uniref:C-type lectin domain-containing protein n=1 Tax=Cylicocyclus nassatus TaxID=53992 RepID=A0AA36H1B9_CYLNA|nr:unnamed protein product [Cylicocyclus nassatus]
MRILLVALIPLAETFLNPENNQLISRFSEQSAIPYYLEHSNAACTCTGRCETGWTYFNETDACYKTFFWKNFDEAEGVCRTLGGHLTSIHSFLENDFVAELAKSGKPYTSCCSDTTWIGLRRPDPVKSNWTWTDGTEVDFLAWAPNEPDNWGGIQRCVLV